MNSCIVDRLNSLKEIFILSESECNSNPVQAQTEPPPQVFESDSGENTKSPNQDVINLTNEIKTEIDVEKLCSIVWPALVVIGGVDRGLKIGGQCLHKTFSKKGILLGTLKKGLTTVKVQWEQDGSITDVPFSSLQAIDSPPFHTSKLTGISAEVFRLITRLTGLTGEMKFPEYDLSLKELQILSPNERRLSSEKRRHSWYSCDVWRSNSDSQIPNQETINKQSTTRTVESLTNEMVSVILGEVTNRLTTEKNVHTQSESQLKDVDSKNDEGNNRVAAKLLKTKLLNCELISLRLAFLQFAAMKALNSLLTASKYTELLLIPGSFSCTKLSDNKSESSTELYDEDELKDALKYLMKCVVNKSVESCKLKSVVNLAEIERAQTVLHSMYTKSKSEEGLELDEIKLKINKILSKQNQQCGGSSSSSVANQRNNADSNVTAVSSSTRINNSQSTSANNIGGSNSTSIQGPFRLSRGNAIAPPTSLHIAQINSQTSLPSIQRTIYSDPVTPLRSQANSAQSSALNITSNQNQNQNQDGVGVQRDPTLRDVPLRRTTPLPPIAQPLLEMGFNSSQIMQALAATGLSGDLSTHSVNFLAMWMVEHPNWNNREEQEEATVTSAPATSFRSNTSSQDGTMLRQQVSIFFHLY